MGRTLSKWGSAFLFFSLIIFNLWFSLLISCMELDGECQVLFVRCSPDAALQTDQEPRRRTGEWGNGSWKIRLWGDF